MVGGLVLSRVEGTTLVTVMAGGQSSTLLGAGLAFGSDGSEMVLIVSLLAISIFVRKVHIFLG